MTTIGVLSDTHIFDSGRRRVPDEVFEWLRDCDLILHGGDIVAWSVIERLEQIAPVLAVCGNNDPSSYGLPASRRVEVEGCVIGLSHGDVARAGMPNQPRPLPGIKGNGTTAACALSHFEFDGDVSCLVFGHSHNPLLHRMKLGSREMLLFNPGSPTDRRYSPHFGCGLLRVEGEVIKPELLLWH